MSARAEHVQLLAKAHGFSTEELDANRAGSLHPNQLARTRSLAGFLVPMVIGDVFLIGGLAGAFFFHDSLTPPVSRVDENATYAIAGAGVVMAVVFILIAISGLNRRKARIAATERGLEVIEGAAVTRAIDGSRGVQGTYTLAVGGRSFVVTKSTLELVTHGSLYRLYVVGDQLLTLEPVTG